MGWCAGVETDEAFDGVADGSRECAREVGC